MQSVLGGVLLAGSFAGLCFWDKRLFKLKKEIIPLHVCACVVCVLFVFGLFHLLMAGALLLTMFGLAGLAFGFRSYTWIIRGNLLKTAAVVGLVFGCFGSFMIRRVLCLPQAIFLIMGLLQSTCLCIIRFLIKIRLFLIFMLIRRERHFLSIGGGAFSEERQCIW